MYRVKVWEDPDHQIDESSTSREKIAAWHYVAERYEVNSLYRNGISIQDVDRGFARSEKEAEEKAQRAVRRHDRESRAMWQTITPESS